MSEKEEPKGIYDDLTPEELKALSAEFRKARRDCSAVMTANWHNVTVTDTYRQIMMEFRRNDPLFAEKVTTPPVPPKPHRLAKDQWEVW